MRNFCREKDTQTGAVLPMFIMLQFSSFHFLFTVLLFLLLLVMLTKKTKAKNLVSKLPPGPQKLPIIGNLHQLAGSLPYYSLRDLAKKYGPIMHLHLGEVSAIVISSPEAAREVLKTHELVFAQRPEVLAIQLISYDHPGLIFSPYGNYWRQMRKICVYELLSAKRVGFFRSVREEEVCSLVESISSSHELPINLSKMIFSLTNIVISRTAFGKKSRGQDEFKPLLKELIKYSAGFHTPDLFPSVKFLSLLIGMKPALQRIHKKLNKILDDIINDHKMKIKSNFTSNEEPDGEDLVDVLLRLQESSALGFEITTDHIKIVILV